MLPKVPNELGMETWQCLRGISVGMFPEVLETFWPAIACNPFDRQAS